MFGLERLGAFALSFSDIDNSARDLRTDRQIYHKKSEIEIVPTTRLLLGY